MGTPSSTQVQVKRVREAERPRRATDPPAGVLVVDDHPAVRAGLFALLETESSLHLLPAATGADEALAIAQRGLPQIALLDISLQDGDGLQLCLDLKRLPTAPGVLLYTASVDPLLAAKARLVGADGLIGKAARANELHKAIAAVLQGGAQLPDFEHDLLKAMTGGMSMAQQTLIGLRLNRTPVGDVAEVLGVTEEEVIARIRELLACLGGNSSQ